MTFEEWHLARYGSRPALFLARHISLCCWCGDRIIPGDDGCYWPEHDATVAHAGCLIAVWKASV